MLFIGEFLLSLFDDLEMAEIIHESKEAKKINKEVLAFLNSIKKIDISKGESLSKIVDLLLDIRFKVTQYQINVGGEKSILF